MNQRFYSIQFMRGGAALLVVFHHFMQVFYDFQRTNPVGNFLTDFGG
jgi:peptidoglycan/LPS O-acetylase OafA/YrhL